MNQSPLPKTTKTRFDLDPDVLALGIRQPWGELILQGKKTVEIRTLATKARGLIYLYAGKTIGKEEYVKSAILEHQLKPENLSKQGLIGSVEIVGCRPCEKNDALSSCVSWEILEGKYAWELANPVRFDQVIPVIFLPYGVWFYPFKRRQES